jgi:uncharacterized membrane protein
MNVRETARTIDMKLNWMTVVAIIVIVVGLLYFVMKRRGR